MKRRILVTKLSTSAGFTLVEVLIAAVIAIIGITAGFQVLINQDKNQHIQFGISDMQQNGRASVDELTQKIRMAGYRVPIGVPILEAWDANPDTIAITFLHEPLCTASLSSPMPKPSSELKCVGSDVSCFEDDTWAFIYDPSTMTGEFFLITHVQNGAMHIQHNTMPLSKVYPSGSQLYTMDYFKYYVNYDDTTHPVMMVEHAGRIPEIYADNIEDLQFLYTLADGSVSDTIMLDRMVREVSIAVSARTDRNDLFLEDYRRETFQTRVTVRNLAL